MKQLPFFFLLANATDLLLPLSVFPDVMVVILNTRCSDRS